jgi:PKHD-type hydroxylase
MHGWNYLFRQHFTPEECEVIVEIAQSFPENEATVGHGGRSDVNATIRRSVIRWLPREDRRLQLIFDRIVLAALEANHKSFHFDLSNYPRLSFQHAQFTTYHADVAGHYDWHEDNAWVPRSWTTEDRKVSCVLQLSDAKDFEGGQLLLERTPAMRPLGQGDLIFFPSFHRHKVEPVTKGTRHSLVLWFYGPRFK